ncbi:pimeloyl-ACP methyl ester carboxylesterase [Flavobacteriaceae bacterium MAR_2009_75]|nr:pimeloyl-ACP methyl ester carboxylesterase [Flavobacteriaceae bacterium MAR_2009_75]
MKNIVTLFTFLTVLLFTGACRNHKTKETVVEKKAVEVAIQNQSNTYELKPIAINGDTLHYVDIGKGEPVVFVHGSIGDYRAWQNQIDTFASKYRVIAYSRRYAWPNAQPLSDTLDYSAGQHAKDLAQLLKKLDLGSAHLVGHSWGGYTVLKTAIDHPELVLSMVLGEPAVAPLMAGSKEGDSLISDINNTVILPATKFFAQQQKDSAVATFVAGVMGSKDFYSKVPQEIRNQWLQNTTESEGGFISKNNWTPISTNEVEQLNAPTLLIKGEHSPRFFGEIIDTLVTLLPNNELKILPKASHGLQVENPEEFNTIVFNFIAKN